MATLSAEDIIPDLYNTDESNIVEDIVDDLEYDLFNLVAINKHPLPQSDDFNEAMKSEARRATQLLVKHLLELPFEDTDIGKVAILPAESMRLPREKPVPEPKPMTRWEKFAKEKGIQKKKRERMVFDDDQQQWAPRYGYKRAKAGDIDMPVLEVKPGQDPFADPWDRLRDEKKARIDRNKERQQNNKLRAKGELTYSNKKKGIDNSTRYTFFANDQHTRFS